MTNDSSHQDHHVETIYSPDLLARQIAIEEQIDAIIQRQRNLPDLDDIQQKKPHPTETLPHEDNPRVISHKPMVCYNRFNKYIWEFSGLIIGVLLSLSALQFLSLHFVFIIIFCCVIFLFLWQIFWIIKKNLTTYYVDRKGIESLSPMGNDFIAWNDIDKILLTYYKPLLLGNKGCFTLTISAGAYKMVLDYSIDYFPIIVASVATVIRKKHMVLDAVTRINFSSMGHLFSHMDFTTEELADLKHKKTIDKQRALYKNYQSFVKNNKK